MWASVHQRLLNQILKLWHIGIVVILRLKVFSIYIGATLKGKNMLPKENIFFPLIVTPFIIGLS